MYGGVQWSKGELLPDRELDRQEDHIRTATWAGIDRFRTDQGLQPARRSGFDSVAAQGTAVEFAAAGITGSFTSSTPHGPDAFALTNGGPYCA